MHAQSEITNALEDARQQFIRYILLCNAGGCIATLSLVGTALGSCTILPLATLPLLLFFLGLCVPAFLINSKISHYWRSQFTWEEIAAQGRCSLIVRAGERLDAHNGTLMAISFALFFLGSVSGLVILAFFL